MRLSAWLFHKVSVKDYTWAPDSGPRDDAYHEASARRFLARFGDRLDFTDKRVLDVGCATGALCGVVAEAGAGRVVGVDVELPPRALEALHDHHGAAADRIELVETSGDLSELGDERFDVVISKESMEHYDDPETFTALMAARVAPSGDLVIGVGPLWKAFDGGHMGYMTRLPWAHLLFPEDVIMAERRRYRPEEHAASFSEIRGGLNKMTLERFERIIASTGLEPRYVKPNAGEHPAVKAMDKFARIPPLREYLTNNVFGIWRRPRSVTS